MPDLDEQLRTYFDALVAEVPRADVAHGAPHPVLRRRRLPVVAAAAIVVLALTSVVMVVTNRVDDQPNDVVADEPNSERAVEEPVGQVTGEWRTLSTTLAGEEGSPFAQPLDGGRVLVLHNQNGGNRVAGEIVQLGTGTATPIAPSPLVWRAFPLVGWTGDEVVVVGGSNGPGIDVAGAAYAPATDRWRAISPPPDFLPDISDNQVRGPGVWTGTELISWQSGLAFDPAADRWRRTAPAPLTPRTGEVEVAVPGGLLVWGGCDVEASPQCDDGRTAGLADGARYDATTDTWTPLAESLVVGGVAVGTWTGAEMIVVVPDPQDPGRPSVGAYDPANDRWRVLPPPPSGAPTGATSFTWGDGRAYLAGGYVGDTMVGTTEAAFALDPVAGSWSSLPAGAGARRGHAAAWTEEGLLLAGGFPASNVLFTPTAPSSSAEAAPERSSSSAPATNPTTTVTWRTPDAAPIRGVLADGREWSVRTEPGHGLCIVIDGVDLGCDDEGPVLPSDADPATPRSAIDPTGDSNVVLLTAVLPERAVSVGYQTTTGEVVFPPGTVIGTGPDRLYGLPIELAPPSADVDVVYLDAEGRELPVPSL